jgi:hypothetical protein
MSAKRKRSHLPPCPDPEKYILVKAKEGPYWRRKRGTVKPARLNRVFAQNVINNKVASPAAKRIIQKLRPWLQDLNTGRLTARLAGQLIKTLNQQGCLDFSLLKGFEFQQLALGRLLRSKPIVVQQGIDITVYIHLYRNTVTRRDDLVKDYYFEAILLYGDMTADNGLRIDSTISQLYSFEDTSWKVCEMDLQLPEEGVTWMVIVKTICQEEGRQSVHPRHFDMGVVVGN